MTDNDNTKTLTRADLTEAVYREIGFSYSESSELVDEFFAMVIECLKDGDDVKVSGFGSFKVRKKQERIGRNPKTKESAVITARQVVTFHASNMLKERINDKQKNQENPAKSMKSPVDAKLKAINKVS